MTSSFEKLPTNVIARDGCSFNPADDIWTLDALTKKITVKFPYFQVSQERIYGLKRLFIFYIERYSLSTIANMFFEFKYFFKYINERYGHNLVPITAIDLINYHNEQGLLKLVKPLKIWYEMGFISISDDAYSYLLESKFKGGIKGVAVMTMDPLVGPFSELEFNAIRMAAINSYANKKISHEEYLLVLLFMTLGSRPIQIALLQVQDFLVINNEDTVEYILRIPRVKNRKIYRSEFKERIVPYAIGKILVKYCEHIKKSVVGKIDNHKQIPIFHKNLRHMTSSDITYKLQRVVGSFNLNSERTQDRLNITAVRFRRTIGTRAAAEGHGELIIAEILDHSDTQNVGVYVQSTLETLTRIDKAMALHMAPLAQAFAGVIVMDKQNSDSSGDIISPEIDADCKPMGKCGSFSFCGLLAPLACYTCSSFEAWVDGPHEALLIHLLEERKRLSMITDSRIAHTNDNIIFAVAQVVDECNKISKKQDWELENE